MSQLIECLFTARTSTLPAITTTYASDPEYTEIVNRIVRMLPKRIEYLCYATDNKDSMSVARELLRLHHTLGGYGFKNALPSLERALTEFQMKSSWENIVMAMRGVIIDLACIKANVL